MKEKLPKKGNKTPIKVNKNVFIDSDNKKDNVVTERVEPESDNMEELKLSDFDLALKKIMSYKMKKQ